MAHVRREEMLAIAYRYRFPRQRSHWERVRREPTPPQTVVQAVAAADPRRSNRCSIQSASPSTPRAHMIRDSFLGTRSSVFQSYSRLKKSSGPQGGVRYSHRKDAPNHALALRSTRDSTTLGHPHLFGKHVRRTFGLANNEILHRHSLQTRRSNTSKSRI